jgi:hypothetical protein
VSSLWQVSGRNEVGSRVIADRHYSRQKIGAPGFVPPGRCLVLRCDDPRGSALWVTSWPFAQYVRHEWAGAWVCSAFRNEGPHLSSDLIRQAIAHTRWRWDAPELGMVTFVDASKVRKKRDPGRCFLRAGFRPVGSTKGGLLAFQILPEEMPSAAPPLHSQIGLML